MRASKQRNFINGGLPGARGIENAQSILSRAYRSHLTANEPMQVSLLMDGARDNEDKSARIMKG